MVVADVVVVLVYWKWQRQRQASLSSVYTFCVGHKLMHTSIEKRCLLMDVKAFSKTEKKRIYNRIDIWYLIMYARTHAYTCSGVCGEQAQEKWVQNVLGARMLDVQSSSSVEMKMNESGADKVPEAQIGSQICWCWSCFGHCHKPFFQWMLNTIQNWCGCCSHRHRHCKLCEMRKITFCQKIRSERVGTKKIMAIGNNSSNKKRILRLLNQMFRERMLYRFSLLLWTSRLQYFCHDITSTQRTQSETKEICETLLITLSKHTYKGCVDEQHLYKLVAAILVWKWINKCENHHFFE